LKTIAGFMNADGENLLSVLMMMAMSRGWKKIFKV